MDIEINGDKVDLGPNVRFRAACSAGMTDWHSLGQQLLPSEQQTSTAPQIGGVGPDWIELPREDLQGSAVRVFILGKSLTGECKIEAQVNRRTVELRNVVFRNKHWEGLLVRSDLGDRAVSARYLEVKFIVHGPQIGLEGWFQTTADDLAREATRTATDESWWSQWRRGTFDHIEKHDNRVVAFATRLGSGRHEFSYLARATTAGTFGVAGARVEAMYAPELLGRSQAATVSVR